VDWRVPLDEGRRRIPEGVGFQGNLEPAVCLGPWELVEARVRDVLRRAGGRPDHVFNLGHGVLPATDPSVLERVVDLVHREGQVHDAADAGDAADVDGDGRADVDRDAEPLPPSPWSTTDA
jgi:uroporphyrinogen decarboxylase